MEVYISEILILVMLLKATYTDIKKGKIENLLIGVGFLFGISFVFIVDGYKGILYSLEMSGIIFLFLFPLFLLKGLGAGDIKLLCVLAIFYQKDIFPILIYSFFIAGFIAACKMIFRKIKGKKAFIRKETMKFSIPILFGTIAERLIAIFTNLEIF